MPVIFLYLFIAFSLFFCIIYQQVNPIKRRSSTMIPHYHPLKWAGDLIHACDHIAVYKAPAPNVECFRSIELEPEWQSCFAALNLRCTIIHDEQAIIWISANQKDSKQALLIIVPANLLPTGLIQVINGIASEADLPEYEKDGAIVAPDCSFFLCPHLAVISQPISRIDPNAITRNIKQAEKFWQKSSDFLVQGTEFIGNDRFMIWLLRPFD